MSEIKVNSIKGVGASQAAITIDNASGSASANLTTVNSVPMPNGGSFSNRRINVNGALNVAQRGTSFSSTSGGNYFADRYKVGFNTISAGTCVTSQQTLSSSDAPYALGFRKYGRLALGQAGTAAGTSFIEVLHKFEGQDINQSGWNHTSSSSNFTISFWFRCSTNQTFYVNLRSRDGTSYVYTFSFTASANNTWTKITKTIQGNSNVQIDNDNGAGLDCRIWIFAGTDYTASVTLDQWRAYDTASRVPDMATTWLTAGASTIDFTGFQFESGSVATDFEHRSFGQELSLCQRYYYKTYDYATAPATATFVGMQHGRNFSSSARSSVPICLNFPERMRAVPTLTWYAADGQSGKYSTGSTVGGTDLTTEKSVGTSIDESETGIYHANFSEDVPAANLYAYHVVASAEL
jgi:hypothetical protein|tara:strand:+ start:840 stop:2063 length:1224 start_codon:yes stop_codon:yes gene_type:complete